MTKYFVAYIIKGGFAVEAPEGEPEEASAKVRRFLKTVPGHMEASLTVHYLDELP